MTENTHQINYQIYLKRDTRDLFIVCMKRFLYHPIIIIRNLVIK